MDEINQIKQDILRSNDDIKLLANNAVDNAMGGAFKQRSKELRNTATAFLLSGGMSLLISAIFSINIFSHMIELNADWKTNISMGMKAIPFWGLTWWVLGKYSYERKLQEKYAYKSVIVSVIRNHSELLSDEDSAALENRSSKQIMLSKVFDIVYEDPNLIHPSKKLLGNSIMKNLNNTIKQLISLIKEVKKG